MTHRQVVFLSDEKQDEKTRQRSGVPSENHEVTPNQEGSWRCRNHSCYPRWFSTPEALAHIVANQFRAAA